MRAWLLRVGHHEKARLLGLGLGDELAAQHLRDDLVACESGILGLAVGRVCVGRAQQRDQHARLTECKFRHLLLEVILRCRADADRAIAEFHAVEVCRHDCLLGGALAAQFVCKVRFAPVGGRPFHQLAAQAVSQSFLVELVGLFHELHGEGGGALLDPEVKQVGYECATEPEPIDAMMLKEAGVFTRAKRIHQVSW